MYKANILRLTDGLFRESCLAIASRFPEIKTEEMLVDATAYKMAKSPEHFDVIVTSNLYGDILSDLGAGLMGSLGIAPSANIGEKHALFEPVHGSAPDIAGKGIANPAGMMLSCAMMLRHLNEKKASEKIWAAVASLLKEGFHTQDLGGKLDTKSFSSLAIERIKNGGN